VPFAIKKVQAMRPGIQKIVDDQIDALLAGPKPADLVQTFALPIPSLVICELLGVPYDDHEFFQVNSSKIINFSITPEERSEGMHALGGYLYKLLLAKLEEPAEDLLSELTGYIRSGEISLSEAVQMSVLLLFAGHETTANMIAPGALAFLEHPGQLALIRESDIGNRDPEVFTDPDKLDITRDAKNHLAFSFGPHQCLGQPLARLELEIVYSTLYKRIPTLRLATTTDQLNFKNDVSIYGVFQLPVTWG
jgi:cytochrome P450